MRIKVRLLKAALRAVSPRPAPMAVSFVFNNNELLIVSENEDYKLFQLVYAEGEGRGAVKVWHADVVRAISKLSDKDFVEVPPPAASGDLIIAGKLVRAISCEPVQRPLPTTLPAIVLPATQWWAVCERVAFCACDDISRPQLRGVFIDAHQDDIKFTATDAHRLVFWELGIASRAGSMLVPTKVWGVLSRFVKGLRNDEEISLFFEKDYAHFYHEDFDLLAKKPHAQFPDVSHLFARSGEFVVHLDREKLLAAIRKTIYSASARFKPVTLHFHPGQCVVALPEVEDGIVQDILQCDAEFSEKISFDAENFVSLLERLDGEVVEMSIDAAEPAVRHIALCGADRSYVALIMPILPQ